MYKNIEQWHALRHRVLEEGISKRQVAREAGIHWDTLARILSHPIPPSYKRKVHRSPTHPISCKPDQLWIDVLNALANAHVGQAKEILLCLSGLDAGRASKKKLRALIATLKDGPCAAEQLMPQYAQDSESFKWMCTMMQCAEPLASIRAQVGDIEGLPTIVEKLANGRLVERKKAISVLARIRGIPGRCIARFLHVSPTSVFRYWKTYETVGVEGLFKGYPTRARKSERAALRSKVFTLLHSPPSEHGINRTSWKMDDLKRCLIRDGVLVSKDVIREIIKSAGYRWKKARIVLTSPDPEYKEKLQHIQSILSTLGGNERFFSIDEFGPFAVKMKGGRRLVGPDEHPYVPQFQKSRGCLILTAGLELSLNQVTHFYSKHKNTNEMIKLLDFLLSQYRGCSKIYLSWDAASWHASKRLNERVVAVNSDEYRAVHGTPLVELAPLPKSAQFLNVIESVFSGMARAVIHNSNYTTVQAAKAAIDCYFNERNKHFQMHPKRAGRKIWGLEHVPAEFSEAHNCKNPMWM